MLMKVALALAFALASPALADDAGPWNVLVKTEGGKVSLLSGIRSKQICEDTACMLTYGETCAAHTKRDTDARVSLEKAKAEAMRGRRCLAQKPKDPYHVLWVLNFGATVGIEYQETPHHYWCPVASGGNVVTVAGATIIDKSSIASAQCFE